MPAAPTEGAVALHRPTNARLTLSFDALRVRAHRMATRALPVRATLDCGCNDTALCADALALWRGYFRTGHTLRQAAPTRRAALGLAHDLARRAYEQHRTGGRPDGRGALRLHCGRCHGQNVDCVYCGMEATR